MAKNDSRYETLDFYIAQSSPQRRGRYRVAAAGLSLHLADMEQSFEIRDLSSRGCSLRAPAEQLSVGRIFNSTLRIGTTDYLADLEFRVVRHISGSSIACNFQSLSSRQEIMLDKLLLEIQKRSIAPHAARRKRE